VAAVAASGGSAEEPADGAWSARDALRALTRARRANRASDVDLVDALYKAYLSAVLIGIVVLVLSDVVGDEKVAPRDVAWILAHGPAVLGAAAGVALLIGLRSGARGGPFVLSGADVRHVLMAPIPRAVALRGPAWRQLRTAGGGAVVVGAIIGVQAAHRLPGGLPVWGACGALAAMLAAVLATGSALVASGARLRPLPATALGLVALGWSGADLFFGVRTCPLTWIGTVALWPLRLDPLGAAAVVLPVAVSAVGLATVGNLRLELTERRAELASQIRLALTLQDLRTVVLLRRQLNQELPRSRPWVPVRALSSRRFLIWGRDVHGIARWPLGRLARVAAFGAIAGLAMGGVWAGTTPLVVVAAGALYLAGLEALDPLAQDIDHPDRPESVPVPFGHLRLHHVPACFAVMLIATALGWAAVAVVSPTPLVASLGAVAIWPAALLATAGAAVSVVMGPPAVSNIPLPAEFAGMKLLYRSLWPPAIVAFGLVPVLVARAAVEHAATATLANKVVLPPSAFSSLAAPAAASFALTPVMVAVLVFAWLRYREDINVWMKEAGTPLDSGPPA
jgi:hypothetical protein